MKRSAINIILVLIACLSTLGVRASSSVKDLNPFLHPGLEFETIKEEQINGRLSISTTVRSLGLEPGTKADWAELPMGAGSSRGRQCPVKIDNDGYVSKLDGTKLVLTSKNMTRGEPLSCFLMAGREENPIVGEFIPFPIVSESPDGARVEVVFRSLDKCIFSVQGTRFTPGERLVTSSKITNTNGTAKTSKEKFKCPKSGCFSYTVGFANLDTINGGNGLTRVARKGKSLTLPFKWGVGSKGAVSQSS